MLTVRVPTRQLCAECVFQRYSCVLTVCSNETVRADCVCSNETVVC